MISTDQIKREINVLHDTARFAKDKRDKLRVTDKIRFLNSSLFVAEKCLADTIETQLQKAERKLELYEGAIASLKKHRLVQDIFKERKKELDQQFSPKVLKHQIKICKYLLEK
jgi:hypothetical protein